jgi:outer membrane lipoprotein-sorting protein
MKIWKMLFAQFSCVLLLLVACGAALATHQSENAQSQIATVDAGLGSCRADFTVKDGAGKPLYGAKITTAIKYGFMNKRESDLEDATNSAGQARFIGLPNVPKKPIDFVVASGTVSKTVTDDPTGNCNAVFEVTLTVH